MDVTQTDPMVFRPPRLRRGLQLAVGLPLSAVVLLPTLFAVWLVWAPHVVELEIADGRLYGEALLDLPDVLVELPTEIREPAVVGGLEHEIQGDGIGAHSHIGLRRRRRAAGAGRAANWAAPG